MVVVQTFTELGHRARHDASEDRRAAFVAWVDGRGGRDMLLTLKAHRHTLEEVAVLAAAPINVVLTVGMEHYGVRLSRARDLGEERVKAPTRLATVREAKARRGHSREGRPQLPPFFVQALLEGATSYPNLTPEQVTRGTIRVLRSEAARSPDRDYGYER